MKTSNTTNVLNVLKKKKRMVYFCDFWEGKSEVLDESTKAHAQAHKGNSDKVVVNGLLQTTVNEMG